MRAFKQDRRKDAKFLDQQLSGLLYNVVEDGLDSEEWFKEAVEVILEHNGEFIRDAKISGKSLYKQTYRWLEEHTGCYYMKPADRLFVGPYDGE